MPLSSCEVWVTPPFMQKTCLPSVLRPDPAGAVAAALHSPWVLDRPSGAVPQSTAEELEQPGGREGLTRSFWHGCGTLRLEKHCSQGSQSSWSGGSAAAHLVTAAAVTSSWLIYSCVTLQVARYSKSSLIIKLQGHDPINSTAVKILGWTGVFFCTLFGYVCTWDL